MGIRRVPRSLEGSWTTFGHDDPLWAVMTAPSVRGNRWDGAEFARTGEKDVTRVLGLVDEAAGPVVRDVAMDFGCGVGRLTQPLASRFKQVHGVDVSSSMIEAARERNAFDGCTYHVNTRQDLSLFGDASFDFLLSLIVVQHIPKRTAIHYLRDMCRVLRPGGVLAVELPLEAVRPWGSLREPIRNVALRARQRLTGRPGMEMNVWPRPQVERLLAGGGLQVESIVERSSDRWRHGLWIAKRLD